MKKICIIKTGTAPDAIREEHGDFHRMFLTGMGLSSREVNVISDFKSPHFPIPKTCGVIITGSPANVTQREPWMNILSLWIKELIQSNTPILGVCFGHQILGKVLGGKIDFHPLGMEIGTVPIQLTSQGQVDPILGDLPSDFTAHVIHSQTISQLPQETKILAYNEFEAHHAVNFIENLVWGLQFHPEFNAKIIRSYIHNHAKELQSQGKDLSDFYGSISDQPYDSLPIKKFIQFCFARTKAQISQ